MTEKEIKIRPAVGLFSTSDFGCYGLSLIKDLSRRWLIGQLDYKLSTKDFILSTSDCYYRANLNYIDRISQLSALHCRLKNLTMQAKVNGVYAPEIRDVIISSTKRSYTTNLIYEGRIVADPSYLFDLIAKDGFELEFDGKTYTFCGLTNTATGHFHYLRVH